jgi:hypothetical protein|tara:strand:+ start:141 stop:323 length:183 start_codon:yes stop_codon:yes gene_type:complete
MFRKECINGWGYYSENLEKVFRPERIRDLTELFCEVNVAFLEREAERSYDNVFINLIGLM